MENPSQIWMREHGVICDDNGIPQGKPGKSPRKPCSRCGNMGEHPTEFVGQMFGKDVEGVLCIECQHLKWNDSDKFFREGWESLK